MQRRHRLLLTLIAICIIIISSYVIINPHKTKENENNTIRWYVEAGWDGNYGIVYENGPSIALTDISFKLIDQDGTTINMTDDDNNQVQIRGTVDEIRRNGSKRGQASLYGKAKGWQGAYIDGFYADYPNGDDNRTLFILYIDRDDDNRLDKPRRWKDYDGEYYWTVEFFTLRSRINGGPAGPGTQLIMMNNKSGELIGTIKIPDEMTPMKTTNEFIDGNYRIYVDAIEPTPIENVTYTLVDQNRVIYGTPDERSLGFDGNLTDILWVDEKYLQAQQSSWVNSTIDDIYYADYPSGLNNRTLYVVYKDLDRDNKLSSGDVFYCRNEQNGGFGNNRSLLQLHDAYDRWIDSIQFEQLNDTFEWNISVVNGTYVIEILDVQSRPVSDLYISLVDENNNFLPVTVRNSEQSLDEIVYITFDQEGYDYAKNDSSHSTYGDHFFSTWRGDLTLYIVFIDSDSNGRLDPGERFLVRSSEQDGIVEEGYIMRIYDEEPYGLYESIRFPEIT